MVFEGIEVELAALRGRCWGRKHRKGEESDSCCDSIQALESHDRGVCLFLAIAKAKLGRKIFFESTSYCSFMISPNAYT
jgi:hypothetical protein